MSNSYSFKLLKIIYIFVKYFSMQRKQKRRTTIEKNKWNEQQK